MRWAALGDGTIQLLSFTHDGGRDQSIDRLIREMSLRREARSAHHDRGGLYGDRARRSPAIRPRRSSAGTVGNLLNLHRRGAGARDAAPGGEGVAARHSAAHRLRCDPRVIAHCFPSRWRRPRLFDPEIWELTAREAAKEAAADGVAMTFAPMLDVARDPRWGRSAEGPGEDPWLGVRIAEAKVRGFQGAELAAGDALAAVAKHYCAYGAVTAGRDYAAVDISRAHACRRCICPPSRRRSPPACPRSCPPSPISPAFP